jgi:hypothetical protein
VVAQNQTISLQKEAVLNVICYFDIFGHPLNIHEIQRNLSVNMDPDALSVILHELVCEGFINRYKDFYFPSSQ